MPTLDGGHYFLTTLVPVKTEPVRDDGVITSPVHALRKQLAKLPTAAQSPSFGGGQSPFARNTRNHFARLVIIDDVAYVGREPINTLRSTFKQTDLLVAQPQDHLSHPFLLFVAEFDAASGDDSERNSYLTLLWETMQKELKEIFTFCYDFDAKVSDAASFAAYIARCQIETTMPYNDYYIDKLDLPDWPFKGYKNAAITAGLGALGLGIFGASVWGLMPGLTLFLIGALPFAYILYAGYSTMVAAAAKPFPAAPDGNLPTILKALHLQRVFTRFAIDSQMLAVDADPASAQKLQDNFGAFVKLNQPDNLAAPTQQPGVIGI
ncbi:hypothetical protein CU048_03035 [Beijerinckiaceae bacterium]|nr:hypothetical protein CU048_03035 [Beijerinckiaceae bacterium]